MIGEHIVYSRHPFLPVFVELLHSPLPSLSLSGMLGRKLYIFTAYDLLIQITVSFHKIVPPNFHTHGFTNKEGPLLCILAFRQGKWTSRRVSWTHYIQVFRVHYTISTYQTYHVPHCCPTHSLPNY